jgi:MFS family permease
MGFEYPLDKLSFKTRGIITLISSFWLHFILGCFYLWGSIVSYTVSYLNWHGSNVSKDTAGAVFPFTYLAINVGLPFGVGLATYFGFKKWIFAISLCIGLTVIISSFVIANFILFVLFYGVIFGFLVGLLYMVPFNTCYMYYPTRKGLVSGVITGGFGFGSSVFIWVIFGIVNADNEKETTEINGAKYFSIGVVNKYPAALRILGII